MFLVTKGILTNAFHGARHLYIPIVPTEKTNDHRRPWLSFLHPDKHVELKAPPPQLTTPPPLRSLCTWCKTVTPWTYVTKTADAQLCYFFVLLHKETSHFPAFGTVSGFPGTVLSGNIFRWAPKNFFLNLQRLTPSLHWTIKTLAEKSDFLFVQVSALHKELN